MTTLDSTCTPPDGVTMGLPDTSQLASAWRWATQYVGEGADPRTDEVGGGSLLIEWRAELHAAEQSAEIIALLRLFGLEAVADRLALLQEFEMDSEPDDRPMQLESLRQLALFLMSQRQVVDPEIGVSPDGIAQVEWRVGGKGILAIKFLPSGLIRFAAISAPARKGVERRSVSGTLPAAELMGAIRGFVPLL